MIPRLCLFVVALSLVLGSPVLSEKGEPVGQEGVDTGEGLQKDVHKKGKIWAVLVAGSNQFYNYRHQADICHAYQIFRAHGVPDKNIIVMMYDDIASNPENPNPGTIINQPGGPNVYNHVPKDYIGDAVTPQNFLNIITGNKSALQGLGSGKVLKSGPNDHVFINFVDRGSTGEVAFPSDYLYADDLIDAFKEMHKKKMYKKLLLYMESSYSGSMFDGILPSNLKILAVSASLPDEESYATYWDDVIEVYLGDLFSVSWMEDIDSHLQQVLGAETLTQQYNNVVQRTSGYSTPTMYGTKSIANDYVKDFFGKSKKKSIKDGLLPAQDKDIVKSQDVLVHTLKKKIQKRENTEERKQLQKELDALLQGRQGIEILFDRIISHLPNIDLHAIKAKRQSLIPELLPCYKTLVDAFNRECANITKNTFTLRHLYKFLNVCATEDVSADQVLEAFDAECTSPSRFNNIH